MRFCLFRFKSTRNGDRNLCIGYKFSVRPREAQKGPISLQAKTFLLLISLHFR